ncbi:MAG: hypothetical protein ONB05_09180 [candidate division KSB1 bacterium]|nr:hypothetical protein [candidate division KSB1 bacterium]
MTATLIKKVATQFSLSEDELIQQGIKAFLQDQLHLFEIERCKIFARFGVRSLDEFDQLLIEHPDKESDMLEDFQRVDYLTYRIEKITQWIKELNGNGRS